MKVARALALLVAVSIPAGLLAQSRSGERILSETELLEKSREAGLLTDWHLDGHYGRSDSNFDHHYAPEKTASRLGPRRTEKNYELVFPEGVFVLPKEIADQRGVFYAVATTYLGSSGEWNVYLESKDEAVVFIDGLRSVTSSAGIEGVRRKTLHMDSGYHSVMVKFVGQAAPFRVAILPLNSGSRRKNNTPYLQASPASEDMQAELKTENPGHSSGRGL
jgi:hypothetical protein